MMTSRLSLIQKNGRNAIRAVILTIRFDSFFFYLILKGGKIGLPSKKFVVITNL